MIQMRPVAMLSGDLLARKGAAVPTSRTSWPVMPRERDLDIKSLLTAVTETNFEQMREDGGRPGPDPATPVDEPGATARRPAGKSVVKFSLRLDRDRHSKLRLAAFHLGRSGQRILVEALDVFLERAAQTVLGGECVCLQRKAE